MKMNKTFILLLIFLGFFISCSQNTIPQENLFKINITEIKYNDKIITTNNQYSNNARSILPFSSDETFSDYKGKVSLYEIIDESTQKLLVEITKEKEDQFTTEITTSFTTNTGFILVYQLFQDDFEQDGIPCLTATKKIDYSDTNQANVQIELTPEMTTGNGKMNVQLKFPAKLLNYAVKTIDYSLLKFDDMSEIVKTKNLASTSFTTVDTNTKEVTLDFSNDDDSANANIECGKYFLEIDFYNSKGTSKSWLTTINIWNGATSKVVQQQNETSTTNTLEIPATYFISTDTLPTSITGIFNGSSENAKAIKASYIEQTTSEGTFVAATITDASESENAINCYTDGSIPAFVYESYEPLTSFKINLGLKTGQFLYVNSTISPTSYRPKIESNNNITFNEYRIAYETTTSSISCSKPYSGITLIKFKIKISGTSIEKEYKILLINRNITLSGSIDTIDDNISNINKYFKYALAVPKILEYFHKYDNSTVLSQYYINVLDTPVATYEGISYSFINIPESLAANKIKLNVKFDNSTNQDFTYTEAPLFSINNGSKENWHVNIETTDNTKPLNIATTDKMDLKGCTFSSSAQMSLNSKLSFNECNVDVQNLEVENCSILSSSITNFSNSSISNLSLTDIMTAQDCFTNNSITQLNLKSLKDQLLINGGDIQKTYLTNLNGFGITLKGTFQSATEIFIDNQTNVPITIASNIDIPNLSQFKIIPNDTSQNSKVLILADSYEHFNNIESLVSYFKVYDDENTVNPNFYITTSGTLDQTTISKFTSQIGISEVVFTVTKTTEINVSIDKTATTLKIYIDGAEVDSQENVDSIVLSSQTINDLTTGNHSLTAVAEVDGILHSYEYFFTK